MNTNSPTRLDRLETALLRYFREPGFCHLVVVIPIVLSISYFYVFLASAGTFQMLWPRPDYYDQMVEGFRAGHLYILEQPKAELLAKADPYADENFFQNLWLWDSSLYKGHYYNYWGPVPALFLWAWKVLTGYVGHVSDQWNTVCYMILRLVSGTGLILGLAKHLRAATPTWLVALAVAVLGLAAPIPFIVARPDVYEASLAAGQGFLLAGLWAAFLGITHEKRRTILFVVASILWSMAFGSRATAFVPVPFFIAATVFFVWRKCDHSLKGVILNALALGVPFSFAVVAYGIYNFLRFDSPFEFGTRYQVTLQHFTSHGKYVIPNIYSYLFAPLKYSCTFPFVMDQKFRPLTKALYWPTGYMTFEKLAGVLTMSGIFWLPSLFVVWTTKGAFRRWFFSSVSRYSSTSFIHYWALVCAVGLTLSLAPALGLWEASMRYAGDTVGGMAIASIIAAFWLIRRSDDSPSPAIRYLARVVVFTLGLHCCIIGALTAFDTADEPLQHYNPTLWKYLIETYSLC